MFQTLAITWWLTVLGLERDAQARDTEVRGEPHMRRCSFLCGCGMERKWSAAKAAESGSFRTGKITIEVSPGKKKATQFPKSPILIFQSAVSG